MPLCIPNVLANIAVPISPSKLNIFIFFISRSLILITDLKFCDHNYYYDFLKYTDEHLI